MTIQAINNHFKLSKNENITDFFPQKNDLASVLKATKHRLLHFLNKGIRINTENLLHFTATYEAGKSDQKLSEIFQGRAVANKLKRIENHTFIPSQSLKKRVGNAVKFFLQFITHPSTVGSLAPSSKGLAKSIVRQIPKSLESHAKPRRILEVGPGTGAFTDQIIHRLNPNDTLHLVEFDEDFCKLLIEKYKDIPNVTIFHQSITLRC